ncbi:NAD(P)H-dependent oxidoreductase [Colwellia sp. 4_MG-2023]|uniref:NAD(P)H-dependent oxidoreductase n=1 Tax=unclassified Colwellia TaxID=196834 RepID=UPI001C0A403A|nr:MULTISPECIES: NAD(P)H-dependent oxidoreductase [unclassified Colwellia]MBU2923348.1 NAD(P)H-dependent oxidoreductase [Colwellia sp. C2M11]MDO6507975.1 NAD(P)H-dependent oxidoreductase [Colwellia sp. 5_MG-2023]MDO6556715.1 NAD(P)H-dependent oxidoreductase [Colwellia sp. 4_MG-2023]MDO6653665.1 NAD(P)H-dependent oxidoreductase [Colwellia sp. 3_MG-2023]MDO6666476.1 NAD(P)H-dependent oxidoreductase [Colwellia sp. 2_MG-2023]
MKHLIIFAHPNQSSLNNSLKDMLETYLKKQQQEVIVRDLYQLGFDPVLSLVDMAGQREGRVSTDVAIEQHFISWAECITFIHPIWWTGLPAILKGYIDRVFSYGFAYSYLNGIQQGLLSGKQVVVINTQGKSFSEYQSSGMQSALSLTSDKGIYSYSGLAIKQHLYLENADRASKEDVIHFKEKIKACF